MNRKVNDYRTLFVVISLMCTAGIMYFFTSGYLILDIAISFILLGGIFYSFTRIRYFSLISQALQIYDALEARRDYILFAKIPQNIRNINQTDETASIKEELTSILIECDKLLKYHKDIIQREKGLYLVIDRLRQEVILLNKYERFDTPISLPIR